MAVRGRRSFTAPFILATISALAPLPIAAPAPAAAGTELLPDLQMAAPYKMKVQRKRNGRRLLRFGTIVWNVGDGPLEIRSRDRAGLVMNTVVQRIKQANGRFVPYAPTGASVFYSGDGHDHWHLRGFVNVELMPTPTGEAPTPEKRALRKLGFCLVDLVRATDALRPAGASLKRRYRVAGCGDMDSTSLRMGISAGWGDDYRPFFTHQTVNITDLPPGTYRLCATVNGDAMWRERGDNLANNSYWVDIAINPLAGSAVPVAEGLSACATPPPTP